MPTLQVRVNVDDFELLQQLLARTDGLAFADDVGELLEHLARSAADGVRRPGSWERGWIVQATGALLDD